MDWQARAVGVFHCITCRMLISLLMRASTYRQRLHYHKTSLTPSSVAAAKSRPRKLIYPRVKGWNIQWLVWIKLRHPRRACHWRRSAQREASRSLTPFVAKADFSSSLSMASWRRSSAQTERGIAELDASFSFSSLSLATLFFSSLIEAS